MKYYYLDISVVITIVLDQPRSAEFLNLIKSAKLYSHELLVSECFAVAKREEIAFSDMAKAIQEINIVTEIPQLETILEEILQIGYCRGADLHHLACAKFLAPDFSIGFLSADNSQERLARLLGFPINRA